MKHVIHVVNTDNQGNTNHEEVVLIALECAKDGTIQHVQHSIAVYEGQVLFSTLIIWENGE